MTKQVDKSYCTVCSCKHIMYYKFVGKQHLEILQTRVDLGTSQTHCTILVGFFLRDWTGYKGNVNIYIIHDIHNCMCNTCTLDH